MARLACFLTVVCLVASAVAQTSPGVPRAVQADSTPFALGKGGLSVHVGCGDGSLLPGLRSSGSSLVHGLSTDAAEIARARAMLRRKGINGPVSVALFDGKHLPYIDNSVNAICLQKDAAVTKAEVMRVLCPGGILAVKEGDLWGLSVKPRPKNTDEWTHFLYDATNNAVSRDTVVAPPRGLQWQAGPKWSRHHDHMSSISACVTAGGRIFYIVDEATRASILTPPDWKLVARDAYNGALLWKQPIPEWYPHMLRLKSGPGVLPRRLVAVGDRVYVTLGIDAPASAIDAASGKVVRSYEGTGAAQEILCDNGVLYIVTDLPEEAAEPTAEPKGPAAAKRRGAASRKVIWTVKNRKLMAVQAESGKLLWEHQTPLLPGTAALDDDCVYFHDGERIVCLARDKGQPKWKSEPIAGPPRIQSFFTSTLVVHDGVVLFAAGEKAAMQTGSWPIENDTMVAVSATDGKLLWKAPHPASGYRSSEDLLVVGGLVWTGDTTSGRSEGEFTGRDVKTGRIVRRFKPDVDTYWFHHRCYRGKATDRFLLMSRTGTEFIDPTTGHWEINHWTRGACLYGIMPGNGLLYSPPHPCACYPDAKQFGFTAMGPEATKAARAQLDAPRLTPGPAYDFAAKAEPIAEADAWWTFRGDNARSGRTETAVSTKLRPAWKTPLEGRLSTMTAGGGKLFVATIDDHTVHALSAQDGKRVWSFTAGGRVDSPPTLWRGLAIFGCADGYVYCLRARDGELAWRFRAAPADRRLVAYNQIESVWPVHGSVLIRDGLVHCAAGRSMFIDGGLRMLQLDARTGKLVRERVLDNRVAEEGGKDLHEYVDVLNMPTGLPDILSADEDHLYMRSQRFDLKYRRQDIAPREAGEQFGPGAHLFSPTGFLDGDYWHRSYWVFGRTFVGGWGGYPQAGRHAPAGKLLVFDDEAVYGYGRKAGYYKWTTPIEHELWAETRGERRAQPPKRRPGKKAASANKRAAKAAPKPANSVDRKGNPVVKGNRRWAGDLPILVRGMVLADGTIFAAGLPDLVDERAAAGNLADPAVRKRLVEQDLAWKGQRGGSLIAVSAADGKRLAEIKIDSPPTWDGLIAAYGKLYMATMDGRVVCLAP